MDADADGNQPLINRQLPVHIDALDSQFLYGQLFEARTTQAKGSKFCLARHTERLQVG